MTDPDCGTAEKTWKSFRQHRPAETRTSGQIVGAPAAGTGDKRSRGSEEIAISTSRTRRRRRTVVRSDHSEVAALSVAVLSHQQGPHSRRRGRAPPSFAIVRKNRRATPPVVDEKGGRFVWPLAQARLEWSTGGECRDCAGSWVSGCERKRKPAGWRARSGRQVVSFSFRFGRRETVRSRVSARVEGRRVPGKPPAAAPLRYTPDRKLVSGALVGCVSQRVRKHVSMSTWPATL